MHILYIQTWSYMYKILL